MKSLLILTFLALPVSAQDDIDELIEQLGSQSIVEREDAEMKLREMGKKALKALKEAAESSDEAEIKTRAAGIVKWLTTIRWVTSVDGGLKTAKAGKKPLLVFSTGGNPDSYL